MSMMKRHGERNDAAGAARTAGSAAAFALSTLALVGCSGGGGGPSLGSGQGPDPATVDFALAYVKRTLPTDPMAMQLEDNAKVMRTFNVDADLYLRDRAAPSAPEHNITQRVTGDTEQWDVRDVEASYDGTKLLFAMRGPFDPDADEEDLPKWAIWEYDHPTDTLRRVIPSDTVASEGHDVAPHYLPDGRIVFSSTRQRQSRAILLDENKPQFAAQDEDRNEDAFVLHVMNADGSDIHQISFNQSNDLDPEVLANGRVVFTRWDHAPGNDEMSLYQVNPDGTGLELLYGRHSHESTTQGAPDNQFLQPRQLQNGRLMSLIRPFAGTLFGGDIVSIDTSNYVENTQPTLPNVGVLSGPAQVPATVNDVQTDPTLPSRGGLFSSVYPLQDGTNRMLVSWSLCRVLENNVIVPCTDDRLANPATQPAPPLYGIWIYDQDRNTQVPVVQPVEGIIISDVVTMQPRSLPPVILDKVAGVDIDATLVADGVGILDIRSVYDIDGADTAPGGITAVRNPGTTTADQRPARFIRIEKAVSLPDRDTLDFRDTAFGTVNFMREILGYAPVQPDGSVRVKVPANVALDISILDRNGRRISPRHNNWLQVRPGEVLQCNGCHATTGNQSHGRSNLFASVNPGAPTTGQPFPNTDPALFADMGESMAQTLDRWSCANDSCNALLPSVDVIFDDVWTDPAVRAKDPSFSYRYAALLTTSPTTSACATKWSADCRIVINYEKIIHPLWGIDRTVDANNDGVPDVDGNGVVINHKCNTCHGPKDAMGAAQVPAGQLDLSDGVSNDQADHFNSYRELLFGDNEQCLIMGALQDCLVDGPIDPNTGLPTQVTVPVNAPMVAGSARASTQFFSRFDGNVGTVDHTTFLSDAEKRLIAEWLDIGAQYYNNPFAAPLN
jgi:hypothetical protein